MNPVKIENLSEISTKVETEVFVTQKEKVDKLPDTRGTKVGASLKKPKRRSSPSRSPSPDRTTVDYNKSKMFESKMEEESGSK